MPKSELENHDVIWFVKVLENDQTLCNICLTDEIEDGKQWTRYQLKRGHVFGGAERNNPYIAHVAAS